MLRQMVLTYLKTNWFMCGKPCLAIELGKLPNGDRQVALINRTSGFFKLELSPTGAGWPVADPETPELQSNSRVEIREIPKRYVFVDGKPMAGPLD